MTQVVPDSKLDPILNRRKHLRHQRRLKLLQASWRTLALISLAGGLAWAASLTEWMIHQPSQVSIKGNRLLSTPAIQSLLPLSFPQSLVHLQSEPITRALKSKAPIDQVTVARQLFPPKLIVEVQERNPVAVVSCDRLGAVQHRCAAPSSNPLPLKERSADVWLLDSQGVIMPLKSYPTLQKSGQLPQLTVLGVLEPGPDGSKDRLPVQRGLTRTAASAELEQNSVIVNNQKKSQWPQLYEALRQSPVKVFEIDWQDKTNLILKTELGIVHIGPYSSKFADQLVTLGQMRSLPKYLKGRRVAYIDLKNLKNPLLQMNSPR